MKGQSETNSGRNVRRNTAIGFVTGLMFGGLIDLYTGDLGIATVAGMVLGSLVGYYGLPRIHLMEYPPGVLPRLAIAAAGFVIAFSGSLLFLERSSSGPLKIIFPLITAAAGLVLIVVVGNALSTLDEMQRRIQIEALAIGFGVSALIILTYGLMGLAGTPQPSLLVVPAIMVFSWGIGKIWTRWNYR